MAEQIAAQRRDLPKPGSLAGWILSTISIAMRAERRSSRTVGGDNHDFAVPGNRRHPFGKLVRDVQALPYRKFALSLRPLSVAGRKGQAHGIVT
jgi:hypothetical protein